MTIPGLRAWWWRRQGLDGNLAGRGASEVLKRTGWARSVGGAAPYLALFARAGIGRQAADEAVAKLEIHELPSARGCTYVVPASDFALALKAGQGFGGEMNTARKLGVTDAEVEKLCAAVVAALARGPLAPDELRESTGGAARNLGPEGARKGLTTTLPLALGQLQGEGEIRRIPVNGRLDQQRYRYALWRPNPLAGSRLSAEEAHTELARRFFRWIGPASLAEFQWFSGLGVKAARAAAGPLKLVPLKDGSELLMFTEDREELMKFEVPRKPQYALVSSLDGITHLRRDLKGLLEPGDLKRRGLADQVGEIADLPSHAILDRGRVVGLWEYDPETQSIAWASFGTPDKALKEAVARTESYVRSDLGDARSFSLDSPKSRAPRIAALRKAGAG
ncbi:MAG: crosslink repair DNA glycosylase YcaQ family protein [Acidobacteriota bacterium]